MSETTEQQLSAERAVVSAAKDAGLPEGWQQELEKCRRVLERLQRAAEDGQEWGKEELRLPTELSFTLEPAHRAAFERFRRDLAEGNWDIHVASARRDWWERRVLRNVVLGHLPKAGARALAGTVLKEAAELVNRPALDVAYTVASLDERLRLYAADGTLEGDGVVSWTAVPPAAYFERSGDLAPVPAFEAYLLDYYETPKGCATVEAAREAYLTAFRITYVTSNYDRADAYAYRPAAYLLDSRSLNHPSQPHHGGVGPATPRGAVLSGLERMVNDTISYVERCEDNGNPISRKDALANLRRLGYTDPKDAPATAAPEPRPKGEPKPPREPDKADPAYGEKKVLAAIKEIQKEHGAPAKHRGDCCSKSRIRETAELNKREVSLAVDQLVQEGTIEDKRIRVGRPCYVIKEL